MDTKSYIVLLASVNLSIILISFLTNEFICFIQRRFFLSVFRWNIIFLYILNGEKIINSKLEANSSWWNLYFEIEFWGGLLRDRFVWKFEWEIGFFGGVEGRWNVLKACGSRLWLCNFDDLLFYKKFLIQFLDNSSIKAAESAIFSIFSISEIFWVIFSVSCTWNFHLPSIQSTKFSIFQVCFSITALKN